MGSRQEVSAVIAKHHLHDQTQLLLLLLLRADAAAPMPAAPPMPTRRPPLLPLRLPPAAARLQVHGRRPRIGAAGQRGRLCSLRIPLSGKGTANDVVFPALGSVTSAAAAAAGASCHSPLACACGFRCPQAAAAGSCCSGHSGWCLLQGAPPPPLLLLLPHLPHTRSPLSAAHCPALPPRLLLLLHPPCCSCCTS